MKWNYDNQKIYCLTVINFYHIVQTGKRFELFINCIKVNSYGLISEAIGYANYFEGV